MFWVLASEADETAWRLLERLRERHGGENVQGATPFDLLRRAHIHHLVSGGGARTSISLNGRELTSTGPCVIVNRIERFDTTSFAEGDRAYATAEMHALLMSALRPLRFVVNPPRARGLAGPRLSVPEWRYLASSVALPVVPIPDPPLDGASWLEVTILGERCVTPAPEELASRCMALAKRAGCTLLTCSFISWRSAWMFSSADPVPRLEDEAVAALAAHVGALR